VVERKNWTIVEMARSMSKTKSLGKAFWDKVPHIAIYTLNRCPTREVLYFTMEEAWLRYIPSFSHMKVFC